MGDKHDELQEEYGRLNLSSVSEGDTITVYARRYIHEPTAFADIKDEIEEITFTVARKTHPHGTDIETRLWEANRHQKNSEHWNLSDGRDLCDGTGIDWFIEEIEIH